MIQYDISISKMIYEYFRHIESSLVKTHTQVCRINYLSHIEMLTVHTEKKLSDTRTLKSGRVRGPHALQINQLAGRRNA